MMQARGSFPLFGGRWLHAALLSVAAWSLPALFGGCLGGSSTDTGNPEFTAEIHGPDGLVEFSGNLAFYRADALPKLIAPGADAEAEEPWADLGPVRGDASHLKFTWNDVEKVLIDQESIRLGNLAKTSAADYPVFNIFARDLEGLSAAVARIHYDPNALAFRNDDGEDVQTLRLTLEPPRAFTASLETEGLSEAPCLVFVAGSPYTAWVDAKTFTFTEIPDLDGLPFRLLTQRGTVLALEASEDGDSFIPGEVLGFVDPPVPAGLPPRLSAPTFLPTDTAFSDSLEVRLFTVPGAAIHYTLDGSEPDEDAPFYTGPFVVRTTTTVRSMAVKLGYRASEESRRTFARDGSGVLLPPTCSPAGGPFPDSVRVTLTHPVSGVELRYTRNGGAPDAESPLYEDGLVLTESTLLQVRAFLAGYEPSSTLSVTFLKAGDTLPGTPVFNPNDRAFMGSLEVAIDLPTDAPDDAEIRYTIDGSNPHRGSSLYEGPLTLETSTTIRAATFLSDGPPSVIAVRQYVRLDEP